MPTRINLLLSVRMKDSSRRTGRQRRRARPLCLPRHQCFTHHQQRHTSAINLLSRQTQQSLANAHLTHVETINSQVNACTPGQQCYCFLSPRGFQARRRILAESAMHDDKNYAVAALSW